MPNADVRRYAMTRLRAGDYLLPSNDAETLWRINRYWEDGSLERPDGSTIVGWFWRAGRFDGTLDDAQRLLDRDSEAFLSWDRWREASCLLKTRAEALAEALR